MSIREINFPSANGRDTIKAWAYTPLGKPRAVIQLIHGFGEHSRRYLHMISKFQAAGFVVYADDHIGHGKTGFDGGTLGDPHSGGYMTYLWDEKYLHDIAHMAYPDLPFFVFGHSWGSMLGRAYAALYGDDLAGLMLCGLVSQFKGCEIEYNDPAIRAAVAADPYQPSGEWFGKVFLGMTDRIENPNGPADWIAVNPDIVSDHAGDPFNTFDTTLELVWDLVELYHFIESPEWAEKVHPRCRYTSSPAIRTHAATTARGCTMWQTSLRRAATRSASRRTAATGTKFTTSLSCATRLKRDLLTS